MNQDKIDWLRQPYTVVFIAQLEETERKLMKSLENVCERSDDANVRELISRVKTVRALAKTMRSTDDNPDRRTKDGGGGESY
jgi:hypothetical protein